MPRVDVDVTLTVTIDIEKLAVSATGHEYVHGQDVMEAMHSANVKLGMVDLVINGDYLVGDHTLLDH